MKGGEKEKGKESSGSGGGGGIWKSFYDNES